MSGSGGGRGDDWTPSGTSPKGGGGSGGGIGGGSNACAKVHKGSINSPKSAVLQPLKVGDVLDVAVDQSGVRPILVVSKNGNIAGSLTFVGYLDVIDCILNHGYSYRAVIENISGGNYGVRVEPK